MDQREYDEMTKDVTGMRRGEGLKMSTLTRWGLYKRWCVLLQNISASSVLLAARSQSYETFDYQYEFILFPCCIR
jgi:hypothetical protein